MAKLTEEQIDFLASVNVPIYQTLDAKGTPPRFYSEIMKRDDLVVAYGVTACYEGHTLRNRSGHCVQCNTARLTFQSRPGESGFIYLAACEDPKVLKIGVAQNINTRERSLRDQSYGGYSEWKMIFSQWVEKSGEVEQSIHKEIAYLRIIADYEKGGRMQTAQELFEISKKAALKVIQKKLLQ